MIILKKSSTKSTEIFSDFLFHINFEAALQGCSYKKVFWKYAAHLLENTHAEVRSQ